MDRKDGDGAHRSPPQLEHHRLALSIKAIGAGVWDYDTEADVLYCDDRWHEIVGFDPTRERVQNIADFIPRIHPDDVEVATTIDRVAVRALFDNNEGYCNEFRIIRADGGTRWLRSVACIVLAEATSHLHAIGCITDITEFRTDALSTPAPPGAIERMRRSHVSSRTGARLQLTEQERVCLFWVSHGKTAWETASILGLSRRTIESHLSNATQKLNANNKVHAAFLAVRLNLLE